MARHTVLTPLFVFAALACGDETSAPAVAKATGATALSTPSAAVGSKPKITITVTDVTTGQPIANGASVVAGHLFQVSVASNGADCSGQFVVTATGAQGFPPSVLVQFIPFTIGSSVGQNVVSGSVLTASPLVNPPSVATNDWKVSASCNGPVSGQFDYDRSEFFAVP